MPRPLLLTLLVPLLCHAGFRDSAADPIRIASGSLIGTATELRFTVPPPGPLVVDLFNLGVFTSPLPNDTFVIGGVSQSAGTFSQGSFQLNGTPFSPPIGFRWTTAIETMVFEPGQPISGVPFRIDGTFSHPGLGGVDFEGGGFLSIEPDRTVFAFVADPPDVNVIPEPGTLLLLASGVVGIAGSATARLPRRRRREGTGVLE